MEFSENTLKLLKEYKYSNKPLEQTIPLLANSLGYDFCTTSAEPEVAELLCSWKWGKISINTLEKVIKERSFFHNYQELGF